MPDDSKQIGRIGIDADGEPTVREPIIIKLSSYRNAKYLDVRKYYEYDGEWKPTKKGVTLTLDQIDDLKKILNDNNDEINRWFSE